MKASTHARVWDDVTATLRTKAEMMSTMMPAIKEVALIRAMAEFTEIVAAAYREEAEREGE